MKDLIRDLHVSRYRCHSLTWIFGALLIQTIPLLEKSCRVYYFQPRASVHWSYEKMHDKLEAAVAYCISIAQIAERSSNVRDGTFDSVSPVKVLMSSVFRRLAQV